MRDLDRERRLRRQALITYGVLFVTFCDRLRHQRSAFATGHFRPPRALGEVVGKKSAKRCAFRPMEARRAIRVAERR
jgi:hypothetical protein